MALKIQKDLQVAVAALKAGKSKQALEMLEAILMISPKNEAALQLSALAYSDLESFNKAEQNLAKLIALNPSNEAAYSLLGEVLIRAEQSHKIIEHIKPGLERFPKSTNLLNCMAISHIDQSQGKEAMVYLEKSLKINANQASVYDLMGMALGKEKLNHQAIAIYKKGLELYPDFGTLYCNLATAYMQVGLTKESIACFEKALQYNPPEEFASILRGLLFVKQHDIDATNEEFLKLASKAYELEFAQIPKKTPRKNPLANEPGYRIKLGYVSGDMRQHPVGDFIASIVSNHDYNNFEVHCYDNFGKHDHVNDIIRSNATSFLDIKYLSDDEVIQDIENKKIDVLVDFSGVTDYHRMSLFAAKPCLLQILWIGYFGTLGMPEMDYLFGDHTTIRQGDEKWYLEKTYKLPYSYLPGEPYGVDHEIREIPYLKNGFITFGAFNKMPKITPHVMTIWSKILKQVENSKIFFKNTCLVDQGTCSMILDFFESQGIDKDRIILEEFSPRQEFLDRYNEIDISLDSFPYGGGVSTIEPLLMGVPVVTWDGDRWMCRASASYLNSLGHTELIAKTLDEYIEIAVKLASDIEALKNYRSNLRDTIKNSEINARNFVKHFENSIQQLFKDIE